MERKQTADNASEQMDVIRMITNYEGWDDVQRVYFIQSYLLHWISKESLIEFMH